MIAYLSPNEALHSHTTHRSPTWAGATGLALAATVHGVLILWLLGQTFRPTNLVDNTPPSPTMTVQDIDLTPKQPAPEPSAAPANDIHQSSATTVARTVDTLPVKVANARAMNSVAVNPFVSPAGGGLTLGTPTIMHTLTNPDWISRPSAEQVERAYPEGALRDGTVGTATLSCQVSSAGAVVGCKVTAETPQGRGFGPAALGLTPYFRIRPGTDNGQPIEGALVLIPIRFTISG